MSENLNSMPDMQKGCYPDAVCIHTGKIFDSCKDKDCIEDLRVYLTCGSQSVIDSSFSVRPKEAKLLNANVRVEEVSFHRGCYTVDVTYFYKVTGEAFPGARQVTGLAIFEKRAILYGGEGGSKIFTSNGGYKKSTNLPVAIVEAVDPLALSMRISDGCCLELSDSCTRHIPKEISQCFDDDIVTSGSCNKQLLVTLGQFSMIRLERDTQLLIPSYDYCVPDKECACGEEDPCTLFSQIPFPVDDFFPPHGDDNQCVGGCK